MTDADQPIYLDGDPPRFLCPHHLCVGVNRASATYCARCGRPLPQSGESGRHPEGTQDIQHPPADAPPKRGPIYTRRRQNRRRRPSGATDIGLAMVLVATIGGLVALALLVGGC